MMGSVPNEEHHSEIVPLRKLTPTSDQPAEVADAPDVPPGLRRVEDSSPDERPFEDRKHGAILMKPVYNMAWPIAAAALLSLTHHLFYAYWNTKPVASSTQQKWILRVGTWIALLVKASITITASVAFTQTQWLIMRERRNTVSEIDSMFNALHDPWALLRVGRSIFAASIQSIAKIRLVLFGTACMAW